MSTVESNAGMNLRQAALVTGLTYLLNPVTLAEGYLYPKVVRAGHIDQTAQNMVAHGGMFAGAIFCYLFSLAGDVVIAWALYVLLAPVHRALSLLASLFQLMYTAVGLCGVASLAAAYRLVHTPEYLSLFGVGPLHAQLLLLLNTFTYDWSMGLILFGIHLVLLGYLIWRSGYIPKAIGVLLVIDGLAWMVDRCSPYLYPNANLRYIWIAFLGELVFMVWLLIRGWKIREAPEQPIRNF